MRWTLMAVIAVCACGDRKQRDSRHTGDAAPTVETMIPLGAPRAATVRIAADGALTVEASGAATPVATLDALPGAVLDAIAAGGGEGAEQAKEMKAELALEDTAEEEGGDEGDGVEVAMTYFDEPGADLPAVTPLVIADPEARGARLAEVLDKVGGVVAAPGDGTRVLRIAAPWLNPGYGGVDGEEEGETLDVQLGAGEVAMIGTWEESEGNMLDKAAIEGGAIGAAVTRLRAGALAGPFTTDVLVTEGARVSDVIAAVAALDAAGAGTIGVGVSPFPYPR